MGVCGNSILPGERKTTESAMEAAFHFIREQGRVSLSYIGWWEVSWLVQRAWLGRFTSCRSETRNVEKISDSHGEKNPVEYWETQPHVYTRIWTETIGTPRHIYKHYRQKSLFFTTRARRKGLWYNYNVNDQNLVFFDILYDAIVSDAFRFPWSHRGRISNDWQ